MKGSETADGTIREYRVAAAVATPMLVERGLPMV
jgi:hypothetical protein